MRRVLLGLVVALGLSTVGSSAHAQFGGLNDPSFAYYALYLPRQQAQAMAPGPEATLNQVAAARQQFASTGRNGMFDPSGQGLDSFDTDGEFSPTGKNRKRSLTTAGSGRYGVHGGNLNGLGPQGYYNSATLNRYYRDLRLGRGKNMNVSVTTGRRGMSMGGYGSVGGLPGPR